MAIEVTPGPPPAPHPAPRAKPDPRPLRLLWGTLAVVGFTALAPALFVPPVVTTVTSAPTSGGPAVRYVQLQPGQTAPPGALVLTQAAPTVSAAPRLVNLPAPTPRVVIIRTTQSGTVLP